jgi:hypothetical protein
VAGSRPGGGQRAGGAWLDALAAWAVAEGIAPLDVVRSVAAAAVGAGDAPVALGQLLGPPTRPLPEALHRGVGPRPDVLGQAYEAVLTRPDRRARGAFFTPPDVAARLVSLAFAGLPVGEPAGPVVDPAVGGGAFLLAAADALVAAGLAPEEALDRLHGADVDPAAVAVAGAALRWWAHRRSARWPTAGPSLVVADALVEDRAWPAGGAAVVVGNPPFLGQLAAQTARPRPAAAELALRYGPAARGYVDTAALFLLAAVRAGRPGARVVLVQPESVLAAEHAGRVRAEVEGRAAVEGVWLGGAGLFAADVRVCAPVVRVGALQGPVVQTWLGRGA